MVIPDAIVKSPVPRALFARAAALALAISAAIQPSLNAAVVTWDGGGGNGNWGTGTNWSTNSVPAAADTLVFVASGANNQFSISLQSNRTTAGITFNSSAGSQGFTFNGSTLTVNTGGITNNDADTQTFNSNVTLSGNQTWNAASGGFTFSGTVALSSNATNRTLTVTGGGNTAITGAITNGSSSASRLTKSGAGTLSLGGSNSYSGATTISGGTLVVSSLANGGANSSIGRSSNAAANLVISGGTLQYTGAGSSSNRLFTIGTSGATLDASGSGALNLTNTGAIALQGTNTARTLTLTGTNTGANTLSASIGNNGTGATALTKSGTGTWTLSGNKSYTGTTTISGGTLVVSSLANGGATSNIGASSNAAANLVINGGTLQYTGAGSTSNRLFTIGTSGATLDASGSGALNLTNTGALAFSGTNTARTFTLTGSNTGANTLRANIGNNGSGATSLTKSGDGKWVLTGNNTFSGATNINAGTLNIQSATALGNSTGGTSVSSGATLELEGGITVVGEALTLAGTGVSGNGALRSVSGSNKWEANVTLSGNSTVRSDSGTLTIGEGNTFTNVVNLSGNTLTIAGAGDVWFNSQVGQTGGDTGAFTMDGTGTVTFYGDRSTYTGTTTINSGTLVLDTLNTNTQQGIQGNIVIGNGAGADDSAILRLGSLASPQANDLIKHSSLVTVNSDGLFNLNNQNATIGGLTMTGGHVNVGPTGGLLKLEGDVTVNASSKTSLIEGFQISLGSTVRTFNVANGAAASDLTISARIFDNPNNLGLIKTGEGTMTLTGDNAYSGTTAINQGVVAIQHSNGLGNASGGTTVASGAALEVSNNISVGNEVLTLNGSGISNGGALRNTSGNNSWAGTVSLNSASRINSDAGTLTLNGAVSGGTHALTFGGAGNTTVNSAITASTLTKDGAGTLTLGAINAYTGTTTISAGTVRLGVDNAVPNGSALIVAAGATFDMNGKSDTVGSIAGAGTIMIGTGQLIAGGNNSSTTFSGAMTGTGLFQKEGSGTLTISSNMGYTGDFNLNSGTLEFSGATNNFGTGNMTILAGTTLRLSDATLAMNNLTLSGTGNITIDFAGSASTLNVLGTLNIASTVTVTIRNWQNMADFWFAQNFTGAVFDTRGVAPTNYITFDDNGSDPTNWNSGHTIWQGHDKQITPVPEPSTYGAILIAFTGGFLGFRRWRQNRKTRTEA